MGQQVKTKRSNLRAQDGDLVYQGACKQHPTANPACLNPSTCPVSQARTEAIAFGRLQVDYALGRMGRSYVSGFGTNPPLRVRALRYLHGDASVCMQAVVRLLSRARSGRYDRQAGHARYQASSKQLLCIHQM